MAQRAAESWGAIRRASILLLCGWAWVSSPFIPRPPQELESWNTMTTGTAERKKTSALDVTAAKMRGMLTGTETRFVYQKLARGLEIVLQRDDHRWRLALGRGDVAPSIDEIDICRAAFGVPVDTEVRNSNKARANPKTSTTTQLYVADMTWTEA